MSQRLSIILVAVTTNIPNSRSITSNSIPQLNFKVEDYVAIWYQYLLPNLIVTELARCPSLTPRSHTDSEESMHVPSSTRTQLIQVKVL